jgi:hypothetical protein
MAPWQRALFLELLNFMRTIRKEGVTLIPSIYIIFLDLPLASLLLALIPTMASIVVILE